jgi:hypothetical protein
MSKLLNGLKKMPSMGVYGATRVGPSAYEPAIPRVALGIAGVAMTAITIALSVILPAQTDSGNREARMLAASKATAPASVALVAVRSIDAVAAREPGPR